MYKKDYIIEKQETKYTRTVTANGAHWAPFMLWETLWSKIIPLASECGVSKLLDIGCAVHSWVISDFVVERADANPGLQNGIDESNKLVCFNCDTFEQWPIPRNSYEVVTAVELIEHLENPWHFFRELMRITKKVAIITTPNVESDLSADLYKKTKCLFGFTKIDRQSAHHITPIFGWQLQTMAARANCSIEEHVLYGIPWQQNPMMYRGVIDAGGEELLKTYDERSGTGHHRIFIIKKPC